jgi:hypothetical protein
MCLRQMHPRRIEKTPAAPRKSESTRCPLGAGSGLNQPSRSVATTFTITCTPHLAARWRTQLSSPGSGAINVQTAHLPLCEERPQRRTTRATRETGWGEEQGQCMATHMRKGVLTVFQAGVHFTCLWSGLACECDTRFDRMTDCMTAWA